MGKAAILIVVASLALGSMYAFGAKEDAKEAEGRLSKHQYEVLARNAALAGYNRAKQELAEDFASAPTSIEGTYADEDYSVTITLNGSTARVVSVGKASNPFGDDVDYTVDATIEEELIVKMADEAPKFMEYAVIAEDNLNLNGNVLTDLYVEGSKENTLNADMHTNGNLHIDGNAVTVRGYGTYVGSASANPSSALTSAFDPYSERTDTDVVEQVTRVDIPEFDIPLFLNKTGGYKSSTGPIVLTGNQNLGGTRDEPHIWYIDGDLSIGGGTTIDGYTMFIVNGNITLAGNVDATQSGYNGSDESSVAYYASGSVELAGDARVSGQIYAGTGVSFLHGTPRVYGSVTSRGAVTLSGTPKIYYRVASPALTTIFEDGVTKLTLASYSEW